MTVLHRRARTRPSGPFRSRRAPHNRPVPGLDKRPNCIHAWNAASAPMAAKPRPHTLARAADRSSVRTPPPPPPIPGKVRVTPARTGGPSHRYVVGKNKLWFANATRTPPPQTEPTRLERHRHHCFSRPYAGTETATKCRDRRGTISLDWNNCVQCISKLRGACGGCTRSSLVQKKCCALRKAQRPPKCTMHAAHQGLGGVRP